MTLRLESFDKALQLVHGPGFRSGGRFILPTPFDIVNGCVDHNPTIDLNRFIGKMNANARVIEHYDLAMVEHIANFDQLAFVELTYAVTKFREMTFVSLIQEYREFVIRMICSVFVRYSDLMPDKIKNACGEGGVNSEDNADLFDAVDRYYSGNILQLQGKIHQTLQVEIWPNRFSLLKLLRMTEIRNCIVHHDGRKTSKFFRLCGTKYDKNFMPRGNLEPFALWQTLMFLFRLAVETDSNFLAVRDMPRTYTAWPRWT